MEKSSPWTCEFRDQVFEFHVTSPATSTCFYHYYQFLARNINLRVIYYKDHAIEMLDIIGPYPDIGLKELYNIYAT